MPSRNKGRCPVCGTVLRHTGESNIQDWGNGWNAVAVRFQCRNGHMVFLVPARPVLAAEETAWIQELERAEKAARLEFGCCFFGEPDESEKAETKPLLDMSSEELLEWLRFRVEHLHHVESRDYQLKPNMMPKRSSSDEPAEKEEDKPTSDALARHDG